MLCETQERGAGHCNKVKGFFNYNLININL